MSPRLVDFVIRNSHLKQDEIRPDLRLAEDIGQYGLDAIGFFENFFTEFQVQNQEGFDFDAHINEGPDFVLRPLNWLRNMVSKERRKYLYPDVTLGHLDKVIAAGKWFNER